MEGQVVESNNEAEHIGAQDERAEASDCVTAKSRQDGRLLSDANETGFC